ncbi:unnamed protein product [Closterium sp. Naga37s-1]|nr:unnamed protein product [Closterium sp. Naga37s-1]
MAQNRARDEPSVAHRKPIIVSPHGGMSCVDDPHGAFSWADGPLGSSSPSFFASDLVAAHRPSPFALLSPLPVCADSRAALASSSVRELMERCEAERHDAWQQRVMQQRRWNGAAAQPNHSAALPVRAPESFARVPAWGAAAGGALTHSQPLLAAAASATAALWGGKTAHGDAQARSSLNGLCSPTHSWREAAESCHTHSPSRRGGAAAASATGGAYESASRAAAAGVSAGGGQGARGCSAVEREGARRTPSEHGKLRRSQTAGAALLAGGEETGGSADVSAWRAVSGAGGSQATAAALTSSRRLHSCASAVAAAPGSGGDGADGWMWEYQGCCEHSSWNLSSAAHSPHTHLHVPHSTARTSGSSFFSPSHHALTPAHDLLPGSAYLHLSALDACCASEPLAPRCAVHSLAPCPAMGSAATGAATGAAVCLAAAAAAAAEWSPREATPPSTPATPALPPIPIAPPSTAPPPPPTPSLAQPQQSFPCSAVTGAVGNEGKAERWWGRLTRLRRQRSDRRRQASRSRGLSVLLTCCVH